MATTTSAFFFEKKAKHISDKACHNVSCTGGLSFDSTVETVHVAGVRGDGAGTVMTYTVMAYTVMAYTVMAYIVMAYVLARRWST